MENCNLQLQGDDSMEPITWLMQQTSAWAEEWLLRGMNQLKLDDLNPLEQLAEQAARLQLGLMSELLAQLEHEARQVVLGGGEEEKMMMSYARLVQYVELAGR